MFESLLNSTLIYRYVNGKDHFTIISIQKKINEKYLSLCP